MSQSLSSAAVRAAVSAGNQPGSSSSTTPSLSADLEGMTRDELVLCVVRARDKIAEQHRVIEARDDELHRVLERNRSLSKQVGDLRAQLHVARGHIDAPDAPDENADANASDPVLQRSTNGLQEPPGTLLQYGPPSPFFWSDLAERETRLRALDRHLKSIDRLGTTFCSAGRDMAIAANALAMQLCADWRDVEIESSTGDMLSFSGSFRALGEILKELQVFLDILCFSIDNTLMQRLRAYRSTLTKTTAQVQTLYRMWDELDASVIRSLTHASSGKFARSRPDLAALDAKFQLAAFDCVSDVNKAVSGGKLELLEGLCASQYALLSFFHSGHELSLSMNPGAKQTQVAIERRMAWLNEAQGELCIARRQLEARLASTPSRDERAHSTSPHEGSTPGVRYRRQSTGERRASRMTISKQGYLLKQSSSLKKDWKRRWFVLEDGQLFYYRPVDVSSGRTSVSPNPTVRRDLVPEFVTNILICTVRLVESPPYCFEIISPNRRVYVLQAESQDDATSWIDCIQNCTEFMLSSRGPASPSARQLPFASERVRQERRSNVMALIMSANSTCADCGDPQPEWAAINHGISICIECSGIHRSLGSHISKVRSLTLDDIPIDILQLLIAIGNDRFNDTWEALLPPDDGTKPSPDVARHRKEMFIRRKYINREFVVRPVEHEQDIVDRRLLECSSRGLVREMVILLGQGANLAYTDPSDGSTALHVACEQDHALAVQYLLLQSGTDANARDINGLTPRDRAVHTGADRVVDLLASTPIV